MALPTTVPAAPSMLGADDAAKKEYFQALQKTLDALEMRANRGPNMYQVAGALFDPGRTGSTGEAIGRVSNVVGAQQERQQEAEIPLSQMKMQIAGQKYEIENQSKALKIMANTLGMTEPQVAQSLQTGSFPPGSAVKLAQIYPIVSQLSPKVGEIVKNTFGMQKDLAGMAVEDFKANMSQADLVAKYGKGVLDLIPGGGRTPAAPASVAPAPTAPVSTAPTATTPTAAAPVTTPPVSTVSPMSAIPVDKMKQALVDNAMAKSSAPSAGASAPVPPPPKPTMLGSADIAPMPSPINSRTGTVPDIKMAQNVASSLNPTVESDLSKLPLAAQSAVTETRVKEADKPWVAKRDEIINYTPQLLEQSNSNLRNLDMLATKHPDVFALMQKQGVIAGLARVAQEGAQLQVGDYSVRAGLPVQQFLETVKLPPEKQQIARDINRILASEFLSNVKANKGLLGVNPTDNDARLLQAPMATIQDSSKAVQLWARNQLLLNKQRGSLFDAYQEHLDKAGPTAPPASFFRRNSLYDKINKDYSDYRTQLFKQFNP
jgi:hypothetical protein